MHSLHRVLATSAVVVSALPALAQTSPRKAAPAPAQSYTVEFIITEVQTLADGTKITHESKEIEAQDSQGRTRRETTHNWRGGKDLFTQVRVTDPVENTQISWDSQRRVADVVKLPPPDQRTGCWASDTGTYSVRYAFNASGSSLSISSSTGGSGGGATVVSGNAVAESNDPNLLPQLPPKLVSRVDSNRTKREDLGTETIEGIEAHGYRSTTTIPKGEAGNDRPIVLTSEYWRSRLFPFTVREINDDPRSSRRIKELVSVSVTEPELATFQPPQGMEVKTTELHQVPCQER
jgi:hypothetical protein